MNYVSLDVSRTQDDLEKDISPLASTVWVRLIKMFYVNEISETRVDRESW